MPSIKKKLNICADEKVVLGHFASGNILASSDVVGLTGLKKDMVKILNYVEKS